MGIGSDQVLRGSDCQVTICILKGYCSPYVSFYTDMFRGQVFNWMGDICYDGTLSACATAGHFLLYACDRLYVEIV